MLDRSDVQGFLLGAGTLVMRSFTGNAERFDKVIKVQNYKFRGIVQTVFARLENKSMLVPSLTSAEKDVSTLS